MEIKNKTKNHFPEVDDKHSEDSKGLYSYVLLLFQFFFLIYMTWGIKKILKQNPWAQLQYYADSTLLQVLALPAWV